MGALTRWRQKAVQFLSPVDTRGNLFTLIRESFTGAWQSNVEVDKNTVSSYWAVFACVTIISGDVAKLQPLVMALQSNGTWKDSRLRPVLRRPNRYQTRAEFYGFWVVSKLLNGNAYILKVRDEDGFIRQMHVLDPAKVLPLVAPDGTVFYQLGQDNLAGLVEGSVTVPASEIIHDKMYPLFHPLVGVSPLYACGVPAMQGAAIQQNSAKFFQNMARPSGVLVAPGAISTSTADRLKAQWEENFGAGKIGKVAVLGDGLKYEQMQMTAADAQLIEQLKMTAEQVAACFHIPAYKIGVGQMPTVNNTAVLNQQYYDQCLQFVIETMELRLDEGLELPENFETWFDLSGLIRMDPESRHRAHSEGIKGGWKSPDEARLDENLAPVEGGATPFLQQQNYQLAALAERDRRSIHGETNVQGTAMNGGQVGAMQAIIIAVAEGKMPKETAKAALAAAFPLLADDEINAIVDPIEEIEPPPMPALPAPPQPPPEDEPEPDEVDDEAARSFLEDLRRGLGEEARP